MLRCAQHLGAHHARCFPFASLRASDHALSITARTAVKAAKPAHGGSLISGYLTIVEMRSSLTSLSCFLLGTNYAIL